MVATKCKETETNDLRVLAFVALCIETTSENLAGQVNNMSNNMLLSQSYCN